MPKLGTCLSGLPGSSRRIMVALALLAGLAGLPVVSPVVSVAHAAAGPPPSSSRHKLPDLGVPGVSDPYPCGPSPAYACTGGGYGAASAKTSGWPWRYYGSSNASYNKYGPHNCTLYAAYRLKKDGLADWPGWYANANDWAEKAYHAGNPVDQTASVGAIAQWNGGTDGHVAYVESVSSSGIVITEDDYYYGSLAPNGGYTAKIFISRKSPAWPDNFIHFKTKPAPSPTVYVSTDTTNAVSGAVVPISTVTDKAGAPIKLGGGGGEVAITRDGTIAYVVTGIDTVTPISTATNKAGAAIQVGVDPAGIAITPDGKTVYVANAGSGTVTPISTVTNKPGPAIKVGDAPEQIVITPDGKTVYVVNDNDTPGTVTPISTATNKAGAPIKLDDNSLDAIAVTPDGKTVYVASTDSGTVTPISTATNTPGPAIQVGDTPWSMVITPDGNTVYVANWGSNTVTPISTATNAPGPAIKVGITPDTIVITPNGKTAYVYNENDDNATVTPISTVTNTPGPAIKIGGDNPSGDLGAIAITPDGGTVYVATSDKVTPISAVTNKVGAAIQVGSYIDAIAITP